MVGIKTDQNKFYYARRRSFLRSIKKLMRLKALV